MENDDNVLELLQLHWEILPKNGEWSRVGQTVVKYL